MKNLFKLTLLLLLTLNFGLLTYGQTPNQFKYQAVLRDASGTIMADEAVTVDISILQGSATGTSVFTETHNVTTTSQGLINLNIGSIEDLSVVDFSANTYFVEISVNGTVMGTSQLLTVPYALHAKTAESITGGINESDPVFSAWDKSTGITITENQISDLTHTIDTDTHLSETEVDNYVSDNGYLTTEVDGDITNEIQDLQLNSSTNILTITNNGTATEIDLSSYLDNTDTQLTDADITTMGYIKNADDADADATNEIQNLSEVLTENNSANSQIKNLTDPTDVQDAATKAYVDLLEAKLNMLDNTIDAGGKVTDIDGNKYNIVEIGSQVWMAEDLRVTHYPNGDQIPNITDNTDWANLADDNTSDAYCFYYNDNSTDYGALYTYAAAIGDDWTRDNTSNQGVCPDGWHLPSDAELTTLNDYLGGTSVSGGKLKEAGTTHWDSPNTGANNSSGFSAFSNGTRRDDDGTFGTMGVYGWWWSSTEKSSTSAYKLILLWDNAGAYIDAYDKSFGFSVRCLKD